MTTEVRKMTEHDLPSYHRCLESVVQEQRYLSMLAVPPLENSRAWALPHLRLDHPFFVASAGSEVVGWCDICPHEREWFAHRGTLGMGVHREYRGRGIGRRLLDAALAHSRVVGLERIELEVFASNHAARHLYERVGFRVEGTLRRALKNEQSYDDVMVMAFFHATDVA